MQMYVREVISGATLNLKYGTKDSLSFFFYSKYCLWEGPIMTNDTKDRNFD